MRQSAGLTRSRVWTIGVFLAMCALLVFAQVVDVAITPPVFDASTEDYNEGVNASSQSFTHTVAPGAVLIVSAGNRDKGAPASITFNGEAPDESIVSPIKFQGIYAWRNPTPGAGTVSISYSSGGTIGAHAVSYTNVDPSNIFGATSFAFLGSGSSATVTGSLTTQLDNSLVLSTVYMGGTDFTFTPDSGQTEREEGSPGRNFSMVTGDIVKPSAGTQEMNWTASARQGWHHIKVEIHGAGLSIMELVFQ